MKERQKQKPNSRKYSPEELKKIDELVEKFAALMLMQIDEKIARQGRKRRAREGKKS